MKNKIFVCFMGLLLCMSCFPQTIFAEFSPYKGYSFDDLGNPVPSGIGYEPMRVVYGTELDISGGMKYPEDIFVDTQDRVYVVDTGNNRILLLNQELELDKMIDTFIGLDGSEETLSNPMGIFVTQDQEIYIADNGNKRIVAMDDNGQISKIFTVPETDLLPQNFSFQPTKVVVDSTGNLYVLSLGLIKGAIIYNSGGDFVGFYGSNKVIQTLEVRLDFFWKSFLSNEQKSQMQRTVPIEYLNFDIDRDDFIYTLSNFAESGRGQVKKLNPMGENILWSGKKGVEPHYGDWDETTEDTRSRFVDISVDSKGFINILDAHKGRIYQYDQNAWYLYSFGAKGEQKGAFKDPVAIENLGDKVLVLDKGKGSITVFQPTTFGSDIRRAIELFNDGLYTESVQPWENVLKRDGNYEWAYYGIGKALDMQGKYAEAVHYYELANAPTAYSGAFKDLRTAFIRGNFAIIVLVIVAFVLAVRFGRRFIRKRFGEVIGKSRFYQPFRTMFSPFETFDEVRFYKNGSVLTANLILLAWFVLSAVSPILSGFIVTGGDELENFNIFISFGITVGIFILWAVSNWSLSTLTDGEGSFKNIWILSAYALLPYLLFQIGIIILSNFLTLEEGIFLIIALVISILWSFMVLFAGMMIIQQFSIGKTVLNMILTIIGMIIIIFIGVLAFSLFQQLFSFAQTLYSEIIFRL